MTRNITWRCRRDRCANY